MADSLGYTIFLPPNDAVRAFEARGTMRPTVAWSEMMHENHAVHFTVAKMARLDLLTMVYRSLDDVIRNGGTFEQWQANILPELQRQGWWGAVNRRDLTGTDDTVIINERRLRVIYDTNVRMSIASGRWIKVQREKARFPYLRYLPSTSERKRPLHKLWYGTLLPVDDPWWQTHFPPNGWFCKCHYEQVSESYRQRMGWELTDRDSIAGGPPRQFIPAAGQPVMVPDGIDPGFGYNPGTAHLRVAAAKATATLEQATAAGLLQPARQTLQEIVDDPAFDQFLAIPDLPFPVAVLSASDRALIGSEVAAVKLSAQTLEKQDVQHDDLSASQYRLLPTIIHSGIVEQEATGRLRFFWRDKVGKWWRAAVKRTQDRRELFLTSLHRVNAKNGRRLDRKYGGSSDAR